MGGVLGRTGGRAAGPVSPLDTDLSATLQADRLFRLDGPEPAVLHLELESSGRRGIPTELLRYNVAAHAVSGLPVASVLILLRPKANATDLTGEWEVSLAGRVYLTFRYTVVRLWQEPMASLLAGGAGLAPLALLTNEAAADLPAAFIRINDRLRQPDVPAGVRDTLLGDTFVLGGLRYPFDRLRELYMSLSNVLEDSTTYQWILQQGEARGEARGRQDVILEMGEIKFGPPSEATTAAVRAVTDVDRLQRLARRMLTATGWDDLLATE